MYTVLATATHHPEEINPYSGLWNARSFEAFCKRDVGFNVVSPRPFAPPVGPYSDYRQIPRVESFDGYDVHRPRFFYGIPKRLFYGTAGNSFAKRVPTYAEQTFGVPDVIHACHIYIDGYGFLEYSRDHDIPLFVVAHGSILNEYDEFTSGVQAKIRETISHAEQVLCVSNALEERATEIVPDAETTLFPIGADPENFPTDRATELRRENNIPTDEPFVLFCGLFIERKGLEEIMAVLPTLEDETAQVAFVGHQGELREELEEAVADAGLEDRVEIHQGLSTDALREYFAMADLLLLPSHAEGRPTVIYEAMAAETAVLSTTVGGIPEQVVDGETGVLIPPGDVDALRESLERLLADRQRVLELGENGHQRLHAEGWTWEAHAERMETLHRAALEDG
ncbi:glycosyltransferase family 4 protein [Natronolimnobius baerhuensis]|uniref:Glycosyltransferase n=1 Tax=Natronolimnobius baerhuensis TaxID=253108 RepID=A0A202EA24_9EURY|nr:glycosyltransferase family 4 protein [Natronolimnobius baerhuensis]OVE85143.1 glycosyltransferase [Natronolimnobius baerhuensis]